MQKITPCVWFDDQAEATAKFDVSIFTFMEAVSRASLLRRFNR